MRRCRIPVWVVLVWVAVFSAVATAAPEIRWLPDESAVEVTGIDPGGLPRADTLPEKWAALFSVRTESGAPAMLGKWSVGNGTLRFTPRFPFSAGMTYEAAWQPAAGNRVTSQHAVPANSGAPTTVVANIFPAGDTVPENLLKFYLYFSAPMSGGNIYRHIHLRDDAGKDVELPFLEIGEELWDREMKRLTLFIDPGRIKREVKPLEDIGPALVAGKQFTLVVDAAWKDAAARPLVRSAEKKFSVSAPDRTPPDPKAWKIVSPAAGTRDALCIRFSEPMEHALGIRLITVGGTPGVAELDDAGTGWSFIPDKPWTAGSHRIVIQPELEDLAGNSIGKPFEVDISGTDQERPVAKVTELEFTVR